MYQQTALADESGTDELLKVLAANRRRRVIRALLDADGTVSLTELADEVARERADADGVPTDPERVEISLHHVHLPKLADAGLVVIAESDGETRLKFTETPEMRALVSELLELEEA